MRSLQKIRNSKHLNNSGFNLIEMMIIVVIIGILAGMTLPAFARYLNNQKIEGARNALISDLAYARSLAVARRTTFQMVFNGNSYQIIQPGPNTVMRSFEAPSGVLYNADVDPQFFAHGLVEPAVIILQGQNIPDEVITLLPTGAVSHD